MEAIGVDVRAFGLSHEDRPAGKIEVGTARPAPGQELMDRDRAKVTWRTVEVEVVMVRPGVGPDQGLEQSVLAVVQACGLQLPPKPVRERGIIVKGLPEHHAQLLRSGPGQAVLAAFNRCAQQARAAKERQPGRRARERGLLEGDHG
jgi:hypothetical protein